MPDRSSRPRSRPATTRPPRHPPCLASHGRATVPSLPTSPRASARRSTVLASARRPSANSSQGTFGRGALTAGWCAPARFLPLESGRRTDSPPSQQIVPSVRVAYQQAVYSNADLLELVSRHPPSSSPTLTADERIDWPSYTPPDEVVCWAWTPGPHVDFEWARAVWERPYQTVVGMLSRS